MAGQRPARARATGRPKSAAAGEQAVPEVPLSGKLAEFRTALRDEIEAASSAASAAAIPLINGRRIGRGAAAFQYVFDLESALSTPSDAPGDLIIGGQIYPVTIVTVAGMVVTLSIERDLGDFIASARLQSNLAQLMRKLIERIESLHGTVNAPGDKIMGLQAAGGSPRQAMFPGLNDEQLVAFNSALGRDTTFIWGPPGTGKTYVIGAIGATLAAEGRSVLLVSHTNTAVDQALLRVADQTAPDLLAAGAVLRVGEPRDQRVLDNPDLLLATHVAKRSETSAAELETLKDERTQLRAELDGLLASIELHAWFAAAADDVEHWRAEASTLASSRAQADELRTVVELLVATRDAAEQLKAEAQEALRLGRTYAQLQRQLAPVEADLAGAQERLATVQARLDAAQGIVQKVERVMPRRAEYRRLKEASHAAAALADTARRVVVARTQTAQRSATVRALQTQLDEAQRTGAVMRALRGRKSPAEIQPELARATSALAAAESEQAALEELVAQGTAETEVLQRIERELADTAQLPDLDKAQALVNRHETEVADAAKVVATLQASIAQTQARMESEAGPLTAFRDTHEGLQPHEALAQARLDLEDYATRHTALAQQLGVIDRMERQIRQGVRAFAERAVEFGLLASADLAVEAIADAVAQVRSAVAERTQGLDLVAIQRRIDEGTEQVGRLSDRIAVIEEALSKIEAAVIADAQVIATTLTRAYLRDSIWDRRFDTVVLDEASMAAIPVLWAVASRADRSVTAVGDWKQLAPVVISKSALATKWLGRDIFEVAGVNTRQAPPARADLQVQHRMRPEIATLVNDPIYGGALRNAESVLQRRPDPVWFDTAWSAANAPVMLVDTGSLDAWVTSVSRAGNVSSRLNFLSATLCVAIARRMLAADRPALAPGAAPRILLASPYRPHARLTELLLRDEGLAGEVLAGTAHTFQGSEADVVILDLVNDDPHWRVGLFTPAHDEMNRRLLNVAITRARAQLVVVGDVAYVKRLAKHAFIGGELVPRLERTARVVDAAELIPENLAAVAAQASQLVYGGAVEAAHARQVVTQRDYFPRLRTDLAHAERLVVIYSPFMTEARINDLHLDLRSAVERGVAVFVVTKALADRGVRERDQYRSLEAHLQDWGVHLIHKAGMHEKLVFIDDAVLWSGSLNTLSFSTTLGTREVMERRQSREVVADFAKTLRLHELVQEFAEQTPTCPVCHAVLEAAEGRDQPFYWKCPTDGCYSRSIGQKAPVDGLLGCANCAAPVEFGYWGEDPSWRCTSNSKHRMKIHPSHLRLPKMRALVPRQQIAIVEDVLGITG